MNNLTALEHAVHNCDKCRLGNFSATRVFGEGNPEAGVMIIGESPGREETSSGRLFVGDSGMILDKAFDKLTVNRGDFYFAHVLKCSSPNGRITTDIKQECIPECLSHLKGQIKIIKPKSILALGAGAMQILVDIHSSIGKMRGKALAGPNEALVVSTWHPAYLLRAGKDSKSKQRKLAAEFLSDLKLVLTIAGIPWCEKK